MSSIIFVHLLLDLIHLGIGHQTILILLWMVISTKMMMRKTCRVVVGPACIEGVTRLSLLHLLLSSPLGNATTARQLLLGIHLQSAESAFCKCILNNCILSPLGNETSASVVLRTVILSIGQRNF